MIHAPMYKDTSLSPRQEPSPLRNLWISCVWNFVAIRKEDWRCFPLPVSWRFLWNTPWIISLAELVRQVKQVLWFECETSTSKVHVSRWFCCSERFVALQEEALHLKWALRFHKLDLLHLLPASILNQCDSELRAPASVTYPQWWMDGIIPLQLLAKIYLFSLKLLQSIQHSTRRETNTRM